MSLSLANYESRTREAITSFWCARQAASEGQTARGVVDAGSRGAVTAGKNLDGFLPLLEALLRENGLSHAVVKQNKKLRTLPGFFRPTKNWDFVITHREKLVAVLEMKSQCGPSFGTNFNNRTEEALGSATDFWRAFREGAFGDSPKPFLGYLILVEDCLASQQQASCEPALFPLFAKFAQTSYAHRYRVLCEELVAEGLYTSATLLLSPTNSSTGEYSEISEKTGMRRLVAGLAAAIAQAAAEGGGPSAEVNM